MLFHGKPIPTHIEKVSMFGFDAKHPSRADFVNVIKLIFCNKFSLDDIAVKNM